MSEIYLWHTQSIMRFSNHKFKKLKRKTTLLSKCQNLTFLLHVKPKTLCSSKLKVWLKKTAKSWCRLWQILCRSILFVWKLYGISKEKDSNKGRIFLFHVNGTEWYITIEYCRTLSEVPEDQSEDIPGRLQRSRRIL